MQAYVVGFDSADQRLWEFWGTIASFVNGGIADKLTLRQFIDF